MSQTPSRPVISTFSLIAAVAGAIGSLAAASRDGGTIVVGAGFAIVAACAAARMRRRTQAGDSDRLSPVDLMAPISVAALGVLLLAWARPFPAAASGAMILMTVVGFVATVALAGTTMAANQLRVFRGYTRRQWNVIVAGLSGTTFLSATAVFAVDWPPTTGTVSGRQEVVAAAGAMWIMLIIVLAARPLVPQGGTAADRRVLARRLAAAGVALTGALVVSLAFPGSTAATRPELIVACATIALTNVIGTSAPRGSPWLEAETKGVLPTDAALRLSLSWSFWVFLMIVAVLADWVIRQPT